MEMSADRRVLLRAAIALALVAVSVALVLHVTNVPLEKLREGVAAMTVTTLATMVLGYLVLNLIQAFRYRAVQHPTIALGVGDAVVVRFVSAFLNNVLPARGGDLVRIDGVARRTGAARTTVVGGEIHDAWIDKVGWAPALAVLAIFEPTAPWMWRVAVFIGAGFAVALLLTIGLAKLPDARLQRAPRFLRSLHSSFTGRSLKRLVVIALIVSPITWLLEAAIIYVAARTAGLGISPLEAFTALSAINVAAVVPTPANGGAFEAGAAAALITAHVPPGLAAAFVLVYHASQVFTSIGVGGALMVMSARRSAAPAATAVVPEAASTELTVRELTSADDAGWDALVERSPAATLYHRRAWKTVAEQGYGIPTRFLVARRDDQVVGVLPLFRVPRPFAPYLTSGIFGAYGQVLADSPATETALITRARDLVGETGSNHLHLKVLGDSPAAAALLRSRHIWSVPILDLKTDNDAQFAALTGGMRNKIRYAQKAGFTVRSGHGELAAFYDVLAENMHRKGSPIYGTHFMRTLLEGMSPQADVVTLYEGDVAVSGALIAWCNGTMYVPFASSRPAVFSKRVNYLLFWELISYAIAQHLARFDFGTSMQGASTLEFKQQWGPRSEPVTSYFHTDAKELPVADPSGSRGVRLFMSAWSRAPRALVDRLGPTIIPWTA